MDVEVSVYKVPFIGDANVGKTSMIARFNTNQFIDSCQATVGMSNVHVHLTFGQERFAVNIWDTAGQERYRSIVPLYARGADIIVLVFSLSSIESFRGLDRWLSQIRIEMQLQCPVVVCGNKTDLEPRVDKVDGRNWAKAHSCPILFTSARSGENIPDLFRLIAETLSSITHRTTITPGINRIGRENPGCCFGKRD
jgi:small GTP-binding protein